MPEMMIKSIPYGEETGGLVRVVYPDVVIYVPPVITFKQLTYVVTFKWNQPITNFELTDINAKNCTLSNLDGLGDTWTATVTLPSNTQGIAQITVEADRVSGVGGITGPTGDRTVSFAFDTRIGSSTVAGYGGSPFERIIPFSQGSYEAIMEMEGITINNQDIIYAVVQKGKYSNLYDKPDNPPTLEATGINTEIQAGAELVKTNLTTNTFTVLKEYDSVTTAARSLQIVDGKLYFFEGSHYAYYNEGPIRQIADPERDSIVEIGDYTRKAMSEDATNPGEWFLASETTFRFVINREREDYQSIRDVLRDGNTFLIGPTRMRILSASAVDSADRTNWTVRFELLNTVPFPPAEDERIFRILDVSNVETVYSNNRLRGVSDDWKASIGRLYELDTADDSITDLGINWVSADISDDPHIRDKRPYYVDEEDQYFDPYYGVHGGTASPIVWDGENVNLITGYGHLDNVTDNDDETARIENWNLITYSPDINTKLPVLDTNRKNVLQVLEDFSIITGTIIGFRFDEFFIKPRGSIETSVASPARSTSRNVLANRINRNFPSSGTISIGNELIEYSLLRTFPPQVPVFGFDRLTRGAFGTTASSHASGATVTYIDHYIDLDIGMTEEAINRISVNDNLDQVFNQYYIGYGSGKEYFDDDADSIALYNERPLRKSVNLDDTQLEWVKWIAEQYKMMFKDLHTTVRLEMKISLYLELGDIVYLRCSQRDKIDGAYQVIDLQHDIINQRTNVVYRSV